MDFEIFLKDIDNTGGKPEVYKLGVKSFNKWTFKTKENIYWLLWHICIIHNKMAAI